MDAVQALWGVRGRVCGQNWECPGGAEFERVTVTAVAPCTPVHRSGLYARSYTMIGLGLMGTANFSEPAASSSAPSGPPRKRIRSDIDSELSANSESESALRNISPERDALTDEEHTNLDKEILLEFPTKPTLIVLLTTICPLGYQAAKKLLETNSSLAERLEDAWNSKSFRDIRQLGELLVEICVTSTEHHLEILSSPVGPVQRPQELVHEPLEQISRGQSESGESFCLHHHNLRLIVSCEATVGSWDIEYRGNAHDLLFNHLANYRKIDSEYARHTSIVQSSGMGKSRMIHQLSTKHLVVSVCLREGLHGKSSSNCNFSESGY